MIAQINEQQATMITHTMHPSRKADGIANIFFGEVGTGVAAVCVHFQAPSSGRADTSRQGPKVKPIRYFPTVTG
jgi:hypothetical protein